MTGSWTSVRIQIHGLSGYLLQFWSYSFNILYDVYTHNGGVHVHRILIFIKYLIIDRQLDFYVPAMKSWGGGGGGERFLSNIHKMTGSWTSFPSYGQAGASFVSYRHTSFLKITPNKTTLSIIIKCGGLLLFQFCFLFFFGGGGSNCSFTGRNVFMFCF